MQKNGPEIILLDFERLNDSYKVSKSYEMISDKYFVPQEYHETHPTK